MPKLLQDLAFVASTSEGKRMVDQRAVKIAGETVEDEKWKVSRKEPTVVQCGKRKFARVTFE